MATHSSIPAWRIPVDRGAWQATVHGVTESDMTEQLSLYCMTHIHKVQWLVVIVLSTYNVTCSVLSALHILMYKYCQDPYEVSIIIIPSCG